MILHKLFCDIDDFCAVFIPEWQRTRLLNGRCKRNTPKMLCESGYRTLKWFYTKHLAQNLKGEFPNLPSYNRFVELMSEILEPLTAFMQSRCGQSRGIAFVDSTPLRVCENIRIPRHKTFKELAGRVKSSTGWFYGFKLHFMVNDCGEILSFCLTRGNVDDRTPVPNLVKRLIGKLFGDRGYVSKKLTELLAKQNVELITTLKKNMKPKVIAAFDKLILRKRSIIETINDQLKNTFNLEHSRHRSLRNFVVNAIACLIAYSYQEKKPSLNINHADLLPFVQ
ncbi:MAG: IS982 family transposase [Gallionella sp.]|nr:IS982 family transposase [Gallionella sp.]